MREFLTQNAFLLLALIFVVFMLARGMIRKRVAGYEEADPTQATQLINREDALVIDVREPQEWSQGHIPGARHIPLGQLSSRLNELDKYKDRPLITQCRSGMRSASAASTLKKAGFTKIYNLKGGITAWKAAGLPLDRN